MHKCLQVKEEENVIYKVQAYNKKNLFQNVISRLYDKNNSFPGNYSIIEYFAIRNNENLLLLLNM